MNILKPYISAFRINRKKITTVVYLLVLTGVFVAALRIAPPVKALLHYVSPEGGDYETIQEALDQADINISDVILVQSGFTYNETLNITKPWKLRSNDLSDPSTTVICGEGSYHVVTLTANNTRISGFTIKNGTSLFSGINIVSSGNNISGNIISHNSVGIAFGNVSSQNIIHNNTISENEHFGVVIKGYDNKLTENLILNNENLGGVEILGYRTELYNNTIASNEWWGITIRRSDNVIRENKICDNQGGGIRVLYTLYNNTIQSNTIRSNKEHGIYLEGSTNVTILGNTVSSNNETGLYLHYSGNNTITNNTIWQNAHFGIHLFNSNSNELVDNMIGYPLGDHQQRGIYLYFSNGNNISENQIFNHVGNGIHLDNSHYNDIATKNEIKGNDICGIILQSSRNNNISDNCITYSEKGIYLANADLNTIALNILENNKNGIFLNSSNNNDVITNHVKGYPSSHIGFKIDSSRNNTLTSNTIEGNPYNFGVLGTELGHFIHTIESSNLVDGKQIYYLVNQSNLFVNNSTFPNMGYVALVNCTAIRVRSCPLPNSPHAQLSKNLQGILLAWTKESEIETSVMQGNYYGISLVWSNNNTVIHNGILESRFGIHILYSDDNNITRNNVQENAAAAIHSELSTNNTFWHNNFASTWQIEIDYSPNIWNGTIGNSTFGNYWHEYPGDPPYEFNLSNTDYHPLLRPLMSTFEGDFNWDGAIDIFDVVMVAAAYLSSPGDDRWNPFVDLYDPDNWEGEPSGWKIDIFDVVGATKGYNTRREC